MNLEVFVLSVRKNCEVRMMSKVEIEIPDGKLCSLDKKGITIFDCPCRREEGAPRYEYCALYKEDLECTENSVKKCKRCREDNR